MLIGLLVALVWPLGQPTIVVQESAEAPMVGYPVIKHLAVGTKILNHFADSLIVEPSAKAPIVKDSIVGQRATNYSGNSLAIVLSAKTPEVESLVAEQQIESCFVDSSNY